MQNDIEILQLFPTSLCSMSLPEMVSDFWEKEAQNIDFYTENNDPHWQTQRNILDNYAEMKELFVSASKDCLKQLGYDQEIKITTSWLTAVEQGNGSKRPHRHTNSWYSAVYYFQKSCSSIVFKNHNQRDIEVFPTETNTYNSNEWGINPRKNQFIMFPSHVYHSISLNTSNETRHSLVFNVMPSGKVGVADSLFDYGK